MKLYRWQEECLEKWKENNYRGIVNAVTGSGKTTLALAAIRRLQQEQPELRVKVIVPTIPIADQWMRAISQSSENGSTIAGFYGGGRKDDTSSRMLVYIVNSARTALTSHIRKEFALNHPVLLICDECHHYQSTENRRIFDFQKDFSAHPEFESYYSCLGLSATPFQTNDDFFLKQSLGDEFYTYDLSAALEHKIVSPFRVGHTAVSFLKEERNEYLRLSNQLSLTLSRLYATHPYLKEMDKRQFFKTLTKAAKQADMDPEDPMVSFLLTAYQRKEVSVLAVSRLLCCIDLIRRLPPKAKIIVFCERIPQAEQLHQMICRKFAASSSLYHSKLTQESRKRVLDAFQTGASRILVSCKCLDEGVDVPDADVGIVISSSSVPRQRIQRLGRILRRSPQKDSAILYYLYVKESADETVYLDEFAQSQMFDLRYYPEEKSFSNDLYEYAARNILDSLKTTARDPAVLKEFRTCIEEGIVRADYLSESSTLLSHYKSASSKHEKNYWMVMKAIHDQYH